MRRMRGSAKTVLPILVVGLLEQETKQTFAEIGKLPCSKERIQIAPMTLLWSGSTVTNCVMESGQDTTCLREY